MKGVSLLFLVLIAMTVIALWGYKSMLAPHDRPVPIRKSVGYARAVAAVTSEDRRSFGAKTAFALSLAKSMKLGANGQNGCVSPLGADVALAMLLNGVQGDSFDACASVMGLKDPSIERLNASNGRMLDVVAALPDEPVRIGASIWNILPVRFNKVYQEDMAKTYSGDVRKIGSAREGALNIINDWVDQATRGKVKQMFADLDPQAVALIVSTVDFEAEWANRFEPARLGTFHTPGGDKRVDLMSGSVPDSTVFKGKDITAVGVPYKQEGIRFWALTGPPGGSAEQLLLRLTPALLDQVVRAKTPTEVRLTMPKFAFQSRNDLKRPVSDLGGGRLFSGPNDFSPMSHEMQTGYCVSQFLQKVVVKVDEEGTSAVAATGAELMQASPTPVTIDRPFVFLITEEATGAILFIGAVNDPSQP